MLRTLALMGAAGCVLVAGWLVSVVTVVLPTLGNGEQVPFWTAVMLGFLGLGALSGWVVARERAPQPLRRLLAIASLAAVLAGLAAIVDNEIRAARTGDWEAYLSVMGIALVLHGGVMLLYLRGRRWTTPPVAREHRAT